MAKATLLSALLLLAALASSCQAATPCDGLTAAYRYQLILQLKPGVKPADATAAANAFLSTCKSKGLLTAFGAGPAVTTSPAAFANPNPAKSRTYDFAAWADVNTLDDLKKCYDVVLKDGSVVKLRALADRATRVVLTLPKGGHGNPDRAEACTKAAKTNTKGAVRYMYAYKLPDGADRPSTCAKLSTYIEAIYDVYPDWLRGTEGCNVVPDDSKIFGPVKNTADFGGYRDFPSLADLTKHLSVNLPSVLSYRQQARALADEIVRVAIAVPDAPTAVGASTVTANPKLAAAAQAAAKSG